MQKFTIREITRQEEHYTYSQSSQIMGQTGCIGHLRADMGSNGKGFYSSWDDHYEKLKTDKFKKEFDEVINALRFDESYGNVFKDLNGLATFCRKQEKARMDSDDENYGFRIDTEAYAYLMRLNPNKGYYNVYCYCYKKEWLDRHLKKAEKGIRFIDSQYNEKFTIPDGGKVMLTSSDGKTRMVPCRYIDDYHLEFGSGPGNLYHICQLAELLEQNHSKVEPFVSP